MNDMQHKTFINSWLPKTLCEIRIVIINLFTDYVTTRYLPNVC